MAFVFGGSPMQIVIDVARGSETWAMLDTAFFVISGYFLTLLLKEAQQFGMAQGVSTVAGVAQKEDEK